MFKKYYFENVQDDDIKNIPNASVFSLFESIEDPCFDLTWVSVQDISFDDIQILSHHPGLIQILGLQQGVSYSLYNMFGQTIIAGTSIGETIQIENLSNGIYLIVVNENSFSKKIIVSN